MVLRVPIVSYVAIWLGIVKAKISRNRKKIQGTIWPATTRYIPTKEVVRLFFVLGAQEPATPAASPL